MTGQSPLLVLKRCDERAKSEHRVTLTATTAPEDPRCPFYLLDNSGLAWTVFIDEGVLLVRVVASGTVGGKAFDEEHAFALQVVERNYGLVWSAGFSFIGVRDKEYRLDPIEGDGENLAVVSNGDGQVPYQLAAFAHYPRLARRARSLSASFGLATTIPVNELTAMAGASLSLRTLPLVNSGHLTVGVAYAPRKELISDYRGRSTVPAGTAVASLTSSRYAWGPFIAVTFSFFGGEEQFKGVYSGKKPADAK